MIIRKTIQCSLVLDTVRQLMNHPTADEVYEQIVNHHPNISRATVYRNLQRLCASGEIQKIEVPDGADRFDHTCRRHYHIQCTRCGRIADAEIGCMDGIENRIQDTHGFLVTGHELIFKGICPLCRQENAAE